MHGVTSYNYNIKIRSAITHELSIVKITILAIIVTKSLHRVNSGYLRASILSAKVHTCVV